MSKVRMKATRDVASVSHDGKSYDVEDGHIEVPADAASHFISHGFEVVENINKMPSGGDGSKINFDELSDDDLAALFEKAFGKAPNKKWDRARIIAELMD